MRESGSTWASNTAGVAMFFSVTSLCSAEHFTEDAKEANKYPRARSTRDTFHAGQDVSNTMTTDRSQDSRGTTGKRPSKILFMKFVQKQASCNLLPFDLWDFVKCVITAQPTNNIKCIRSAERQRWNKEFFFPNGRESEKRSAIVSTSRTDLFKTSAERGRAVA